MPDAKRYPCQDPPSILGVPGLRGIYAIWCIPNGLVYVGQARDFASRWLTHQQDLTRGIHVNKLLQSAYNKWGPKAFYFTILELVRDPGVEALTKAEQRWMDKFPKKFNVRPAGTDDYLAARGQLGQRAQGRMCAVTGELPPVPKCSCGTCRSYRAKRLRHGLPANRPK